MWKALTFKELRDVMPIACIALLAYLACVGTAIGYPILSFIYSYRASNVGMPFLSNDMIPTFILFSFAFTVGLGFWQTMKESYSGTWLFLLHRPANRKLLIAMKLIVGASIYLLISAAAVLLYAAWAATPGTHASPFAWWMTVPVWKTWLMMVVCYLAAFLSGIRPARWFGTRLLPLVTSSVAALGTGAMFLWSTLLGGLCFLLLCALLTCLIFYVARIRDFS